MDAADEEAIRALFRAKQRDADSPILLLVHSEAMFEKLVASVPPAARRAMDAFWPGGITIVCEARPGGSRPCSPQEPAGSASAFRATGWPWRLPGPWEGPITGTSANRSGMPPCASADEVVRAFPHGVDLVVDGGHTPGAVGLDGPSMSPRPPPRLLREGMISRDELERALGGAVAV